MANRRPKAVAPKGRRAQERPLTGAGDSLSLLNDIVCGVDGTRAAYEAVRQAAWLTGPRGQLSLLAVADLGAGRYSEAALAPVRAQRRLEYARRLAANAGVSASIEIDQRGPVAEILLERAREHQLLALGAPSMSRHAHLFVGGVATQAAHALPTSLLVARRPPTGVTFGERIMVATDALETSDALVGFAVSLAQERKTELLMLHAPGHASRFRPTNIARQAEMVGQVLGGRTRMCVVPGRANAVIVDTAARERTSLLIVGSRRLRGVRALGSVSERVVHTAPCSVLVLRPEDWRG